MDDTPSTDRTQRRRTTEQTDRTAGRRDVVKALGSAALVGVLGAGTASAQSTTTAVDVEVRLSETSVAEDEATTASVVLVEAPDGISGADLTVSVSDTAVATVENVALGEALTVVGDDDLQLADDGSSASAMGYDLERNVQSGATDVELATVTLSGQSSGEVDVAVDVERIDDDEGYTVSTNTTGATLTVSPSESADGDDGSDGSDDTSNGPIAEIDPRATEVEAGDWLPFSVTDRSGSDAWITSLEWDFGDGETGSGWWVAHTYDSPGTYTVALTATDDDGRSTTDEVTVEIE
ncbi:PKD domain-containing protein [Halomicrobium salinisoli]|uniref:PKD domain-containing protein n=1 Tax=Halomicrobium salinisoli TaxID=2878391 RepID=UPI001CF0D222|nr:PKD domain-containing protein [Halomicrobium salinisoli]